MSPHDPIAWLLGGLFFLFLIVVIVLYRGRSSALRERLMSSAVSFGWESPRRIWWNGAIRATWRGFAVELLHMNRYKGVPERLQVMVNAASPARLIIKRRTGSFLSKPMTF